MAGGDLKAVVMAAMARPFDPGYTKVQAFDWAMQVWIADKSSCVGYDDDAVELVGVRNFPGQAGPYPPHLA
jgi:hypothetical protein